MPAEIEKVALLKAALGISGDSLHSPLSASSKAFSVMCADLFILTPDSVASIIALLTPEALFCRTERIVIGQEQRYER